MKTRFNSGTFPAREKTDNGQASAATTASKETTPVAAGKGNHLPELVLLQLTSHGPCDSGSRAIVTTKTRPSTARSGRQITQAWCVICQSWVGIQPENESVNGEC